MKINGNAIKPGNVISHNGRLWVASKTSHVKPGKGGAFAQVELRDIRDGTKLNARFRATEGVERVILDEVACTYLYAEGDTHIFMHSETFEQISIMEEMIGVPVAFLQDGMTVSISMYEAEPISVTMPDQTIVTIIEADAVVKGQTASNSFKPATLENGFRISVPPFIQQDEEIVVSTQTLEYVERA